MSKKTVNLTRVAIEEELDFLLKCAPDRRTPSEFLQPQIRQALLEEVLSQIPSRKIAIDSQDKDLLPTLLHCVSTQKRLKIEMLLQQAIQNRLTQWRQWQNLQLAPKWDSCPVPLQCFG